MKEIGPRTKLALVVAGVAAVYLLALALCVVLYLGLAKKYCGFTSAVFFAVQTFTTTGYGSEIDLVSPGMKWLASFFMLVGSSVSAILIALLLERLLPTAPSDHVDLRKDRVWN